VPGVQIAVPIAAIFILILVVLAFDISLSLYRLLVWVAGLLV
jgi:hypothetical protein